MMNKKYLYLGIGIVLIVGVFIWVFSRNSSSEESAKTMTDTNSQSQVVSPPVCEPKKVSAEMVKKTAVPAGSLAKFSIIGFGEVAIKLDSENAPKTVENFKKLVASGFYDCLSFHRIAPGFVVQGGDPNGDGTGGPGYTVPAEIKLKHKRGSVAMARLPDAVNPQRDSSGSQFYIALKDLPMLDGQYTVFGEVVSGMEIVDKVAGAPLKIAGSADGQPKDAVLIEKATIIQE